MKKKKILITSVHMGIGGIETVLINFLKSINYKKYDVDLVLYKKTGVNLEKIPKEVNVYSPYSFKKNKFLDSLTQKDGLFNKIIRKLTFNKVTLGFYTPEKKYDVGISYAGYHFLSDMFIIKSHCKKKYIWVHTDVEYCIKNYKNYKKEFCRNAFKYDYFDKIITVSKSTMESFSSVLPKHKNKLSYVWNIFPDVVEKNKIELSSNYNILCIGRLVKQKGYDRLIDVVELLSKERNDFCVYVLGNGELKNEIESCIRNKNLDNYIKLLGAKNNIFEYLNSADLVLSTSYYEGLCTTLVEALSSSVPVVAPNVTGISDIAYEIAPKNSFILTENTVNSIKDGVVSAMSGKVKKEFKFNVKKYNNITIKKYDRLLDGRL